MLGGPKSLRGPLPRTKTMFRSAQLFALSPSQRPDQRRQTQRLIILLTVSLCLSLSDQGTQHDRS